MDVRLDVTKRVEHRELVPRSDASGLEQADGLAVPPPGVAEHPIGLARLVCPIIQYTLHLRFNELSRRTLAFDRVCAIDDGLDEPLDRRILAIEEFRRFVGVVVETIEPDQGR